VRGLWARGLTLRARLVVCCVALVAVVAVVVGAVTSVALQSYLERQMDERLSESVARDHGRGLDFVAAPGNPLESVGVRGGSGVTSVNVTDESDGSNGSNGSEGSGTRIKAHLERLDAAQVKALESVARDGKPHTVTVPGLGEYRVLAGSADSRLGKLPPGDFPGPLPGIGSDQGGSESGTATSGTATSGTATSGTVTSGTAASGRPAIPILGFPLKDVQDTVRTLVVVVVCVTLAALVAAGLAGNALVGAALRPLRRIAATATRVSELPLDRGEVALHERVPQAQADSRTEVGQVGAALNRMLGHVGSALTARQESETQVRRFVADASHELRTPLASIRGYAELTRRSEEAAATGPDTRHALGRIESEATRMTGLVEDLLLLARLDAGAESTSTTTGPGGAPLFWESTDLLPLVVDAVSDARAAGQDHSWRLELPAEPVLVRGDPARLQQVMVNLLGNARTHTPPGTRVTASVRIAGPPDEPGRRAVVIEVRDNGPGIPPELLSHVFERFTRGDASRTRPGATVPGRGGTAARGGTAGSTTVLRKPVAQTAGSTGLGLAIVRAVVVAHGGSVTVSSTAGRTVFAVRLDRIPAGG
jgi:two-component system OmpR family sensor kinase